MKLGEIIKLDRERTDGEGFEEWRCTHELASGETEGVYTISTLDEVKHHIRLRLAGPKPPVATVAVLHRHRRAHLHKNPRLDRYPLIEEVRTEWRWALGDDL